MDTLQANPGKNLCIMVDNLPHARLPVRTHVIVATDKIEEVAEKYLKPHLQAGDMVFISEKAVAITQGRAIAIKDIKPSWLANFLVRFVHKTPAGIGIGSPWTMELAIREAGVPRMLFAAVGSGVMKLFGVRGTFYRLVGKGVNAIDGPCSYTLPPYNEYAVLGPTNPDRVARELKQRLGCEVVIIDANDLGVNVLGRSDESISKEFCEKVFTDNPLGQSSEQTPLCIVRHHATECVSI